MSSQKTQKIQTKSQANDFLSSLLFILDEEIFFSDINDKSFLLLAREQIIRMQNSINHSNDFFNNFFKDKSTNEIEDWIKGESKKWIQN